MPQSNLKVFGREREVLFFSANYVNPVLPFGPSSPLTMALMNKILIRFIFSLFDGRAQEYTYQAEKKDVLG
jgi:hypothetical protein